MRWHLVSAFIISFSVYGCDSEHNNCASNLDCESDFGFGSVCLPDGYCAAAEIPARCNRSTPEVLGASSFSDYNIVGSLFDRGTATHRARENAMRLAIEEINASGAFGAKKLGAVMCTIESNAEFDSMTRTEASVALAQYLVSSSVTAVVGPSSSADVAAVSDATAGSLVIVSPSATASELSQKDGAVHSDDSPGWLWPVTPSDTQAAIAITHDMTKPGNGRVVAVKRLGIVYSADAYGLSLSGSVQSKLNIPVELFAYQTASQLGERVAQAGASNADEVLFVSSQISEVIAFLNAVATLPGYTNKTIFLTDTAPNADVLAMANRATFSRIRGSRPLPLDKSRDLVFASFVASYSARFGEDPTTFSFVAQTFDATWLLALSMAQQDVSTAKDISRGLRHLSAGNRFETRGSHWSPALAALRADRGIDISGASGELNFDPVSQELSGPVQIWGIDTVGNPHIVERDTWNP
jgi:ABC-type branched-subunit amino acid transport system substrate-binding protein